MAVSQGAIGDNALARACRAANEGHGIRDCECNVEGLAARSARDRRRHPPACRGDGADRKSVVSGKSVSVSVDLGGRRIIKNKIHQITLTEIKNVRLPLLRANINETNK